MFFFNYPPFPNHGSSGFRRTVVAGREVVGREVVGLVVVGRVEATGRGGMRNTLPRRIRLGSTEGLAFWMR